VHIFWGGNNTALKDLVNLDVSIMDACVKALCLYFFSLFGSQGSRNTTKTY